MIMRVTVMMVVVMVILEPGFRRIVRIVTKGRVIQRHGVTMARVQVGFTPSRLTRRYGISLNSEIPAYSNLHAPQPLSIVSVGNGLLVCLRMFGYFSREDLDPFVPAEIAAAG